jgi:hypothetical protein
MSQHLEYNKNRRGSPPLVVLGVIHLAPGAPLLLSSESRSNFFACSERPQKIEYILFLLLRELVEIGDDGIRFGTIAGVLLNSMRESAVGWTGTPVVQEKDPLAQSPKRRCPKFIRSRGAL